MIGPTKPQISQSGARPEVAEARRPIGALLEQPFGLVPDTMEKTMTVEQLVQAELARAVAKFPTWPTDPLHALAILGEEFGELTKAMLQYTYEPHKGVTQQEIRDEAIQTAAMALRLAMSLPCYQYRRAPQHSQGSDNLPDDCAV